MEFLVPPPITALAYIFALLLLYYISTENTLIPPKKDPHRKPADANWPPPSIIWNRTNTQSVGSTMNMDRYSQFGLGCTEPLFERFGDSQRVLYRFKQAAVLELAEIYSGGALVLQLSQFRVQPLWGLLARDAED
ncbi:hypothetical protein Vadar_018204 [Vaccinium darrowii]|uniref:Uncharacterized protein n=1 Tax=Vaccinium darrowii TaxID=229202 RepID=A0ACB7Y8M0_9ERIC|nr:hypothetical protein Vadar_018204 [Vaccinium darrowii]